MLDNIWKGQIVQCTILTALKKKNGLMMVICLHQEPYVGPQQYQQ